MIVGAIIVGMMPAVAMRLSLGATVTPDGMNYGAMGNGHAVPRPYSLRTVAKWIPPTVNAWTVVTASSLALSVVALYYCTVHVTASEPMALFACALWGALPYTRRLLVWPWLLDAMSIAAIGIVGLVAIHAPFFAVFMVGFLVVIHERSMVHAAIFHWWITDTYWSLFAVLAGAIFYAYSYRAQKPHELETTIDYLAHPLRTALASHRKVILDGRYWLLPWGASLAWMLSPTWQLGVVFVASYVPCVVSMDRVRTYQSNAFPFIIASVVALPVEWWLPAYVVTLFIPDGAI